MSSSNFGGTVVSGIQDISALLPLLGTEQCEQHVGSALEKGYLYPAITPISIFGSLGIVRSSFNILVASLSIRDLRFLGATKLKDGGFDPKGEVAPMIAVDPRHPQRFLAESRLEEMLAEEHIENVENLEVSWDAEIFWWNIKLVLSTSTFAGLGLLPYVAIIRQSRHPSGIPALPSGWGFPIIRVMGSAICVNVAQFIIQKRIMVILKTRLLFITLDRLAKKGKEEEEAEQQARNVHDQMGRKHRSSISTVASTYGERDIYKCLSKFVYAEGNRHRWSSDWASETCIWELRRWLSDNPEPTQVEAGTELANFCDLKLRTLAFVEQEFSKHFGRTDKAIWLWIPWIHQFLPFLLVLGATMIIIGYVGCFNLVAHPDSKNTNRSSASLYLWVALESALSLIRIAVWAINPSWDDSMGVTFSLKLAKRRPFMTCKETGIDIIKNGVAPLTRADTFLEEVVAYKEYFPLFHWNNVELYYTFTVDDTNPSILTESMDVPGLLFIAIHNYKEDTSRLIYRDKFGQFQIYVCYLEFDNKKSTVNAKVDFVNDRTQHGSHSFTDNFGRAMEDLISHYNEIISLWSEKKLSATRSFSKTWAMQRFSQKKKQRRYKQPSLMFRRALGTFIPLSRVSTRRLVAGNMEEISDTIKWEPYFIREEDKAYLHQVQLERLWADFFPRLEEWVKLYILRYREELSDDLRSLSIDLSKLPPQAYARKAMGDMENSESAEVIQLTICCEVIMEAFLKTISQKLFEFLGTNHDNMVTTIVHGASSPSGHSDAEIQEGEDIQRTGKLKQRLYAERMSLFEKRKEVEDRSRAARWERHVRRLINTDSQSFPLWKKDHEESFQEIFPDGQALFGSWDNATFEAFSRAMQKHGFQWTSHWKAPTPHAIDQSFEDSDNSRDIMMNRSQERLRRLWSRMQAQREEFLFVCSNIQNILSDVHCEQLDDPSSLLDQWAYWGKPSLEERSRLIYHSQKYLVISNSSIEKVGGLKNFSQALKRSPHIAFVRFEDEEEQLIIDDILTFVQDVPWITDLLHRSISRNTQAECQRIEDQLRSNTQNAIAEGRDVCSYSGLEVGYNAEYHLPKDRTWLTPYDLKETSTVTITFFTAERGRDHIITLRQVCVEPNKVEFSLNRNSLKEPLVLSYQFIDQDIVLPASLLNLTDNGHNELKITILPSAQGYNHYFLADVSLPVRLTPASRKGEQHESCFGIPPPMSMDPPQPTCEPTGQSNADTELSDSSLPPVIPGSTPISDPPIVSQDYTGYPGGAPPFSPPLYTLNESPSSSAPSTSNSDYGGAPLPQQGPYVYPTSPYYASPYIPITGFIPPGAELSDSSSPPVIPGSTPISGPPIVSQDYTGYPGGAPPLPPSQFSNFPGTPWVVPTAMHPAWGGDAGAAWGAPASVPMSSPYGPPPGALPWHMTHQTFTPAAWFQAQQHQTYFGMPPPMSMGPPQPTREPPGQPNADRMPPFTPGPHYGPVLDPFIIRALQVEIRLNPLLSLPADDPGVHAHLKWNMLFPTSTIQRSDDKHDVSWMNGREAPATFPRVSSLHLVSEHFSWMFTVQESAQDRGVTCGDVIEVIGKELSKLTTGADYNCLSASQQAQVSMFYHHNRSRNPGVPGGSLGKGVRRMDYLRKNVNFAGIEVNERAVWKILGGNFPCTFLLKSESLTRREAEEQDQNRLRPSSSQGNHSRSRAGSMHIPVHSPSDRGDGSGPDND